MTLTHDEINALDTGGLRLEVARVLGWKINHEVWNDEDWYDEGGEDATRFISPGGEEYTLMGRYGIDDLCSPPDEFPNWPRDIAAAWGLVEEAHMTVYTPQSSLAHGEYVNSDGYMAETQDGQAFYGPTAPIAICRAFLMFAEWKAAK